MKKPLSILIILILSLTLLSFIPFAHADSSFGNTSTGASSYQPWVQREARGSVFTAPESGDVTTLTARIWALATENFQAGVYSDNAGAPDALLGSSGNVSVGTSEAWVSFTLTSPVPVTASTPYWLVVKSLGQNYYFKYDSGDTSQGARRSYAGELSDPFGSPTYLDYAFCIYANYTTGAAPEHLDVENFETTQVSASLETQKSLFRESSETTATTTSLESTKTLTRTNGASTSIETIIETEKGLHAFFLEQLEYITVTASLLTEKHIIATLLEFSETINISALLSYILPEIPITTEDLLGLIIVMFVIAISISIGLIMAYKHK